MFPWPALHLSFVQPLVRPVATDDLPALLSRIRDFYDGFGFRWDEVRKEGLIRALMHQPEVGRIWVVELDGQVAGYALVAFCFSLEFDGRTAVLDEFYLAPEFRGQGRGSQVLIAVERAMQQEGIQVIRLEVDDTHGRAAGLYARQGYQRGRTLWTKQLTRSGANAVTGPSYRTGPDRIPAED